MAERQIVALGGGGFSEEPDNTAIDDYILGLAGRERPRVCFLGTASGDANGYLDKFYAAFPPERAHASHLAVFHGASTDPFPGSICTLEDDFAGHLFGQDVIYVGGGNTVAMLGAWRSVGIDAALRAAWERGVVLCGISAGSLCWFESGTTDAFGTLQPLHGGLGLLPGSHCPHYDTEPERRPRYLEWIASGELAGGYAIESRVAVHFVGTEVAATVTSRPDGRAFRVERVDGRAIETPLAVTTLRTP